MKRTFTPPTHPAGDKLAPKIALLVKQVLHDHIRDSGAHRAKIGTQAAIDFFETIRKERDEHAQDLIEHFLGHEDTPEALERLLQFIHHGHGELSSILASQVLGATIGTGLVSGIANLLAPLNQRILYINPHQILPPGQMAALVAAGILPEIDAKEQAQLSGLPHEKTQWLIEAAYQWPGLSELLELVRREQIDEAEYEQAMRRQGVPRTWEQKLFTLRREHLSIADAALGVLRGALTEEEGLRIAKVNGYVEKDFHTFVLNTGEPPGLEQLQEAYRRKFIDRARLDRGIRQSRVRDEWIDVVEKLRFSPPSPADAIRAVVQGHLPEAEGKRITEEGGLEPETFGWMLETAGNPPGMMEMISLWRRGDTTKAKVEQAIREGHVKNKYIPELLNLRRTIPPLFQIIHAVEHGGLAEAEAAKLLAEEGYDKTVIGALLHAAATKGGAKVKELTQAQVEELYYDHAIDEVKALGLLKAVGYSDATAKLILSLTDLRRERALQQAAMSPIRSEYIARRIEKPTAQQKLDALGIPTKQVEFALALWTVDREAHTKLLSEAQIVKANKEGLVGDRPAEERLMALGYHQADAKLLLDMEKGRKHPAP